MKAIVAEMLQDGTAAVAYTLDKDGGDNTTNDREIAYSVMSAQGNEVLNVEATNDSYLDENPQLAAATFPTDTDGEERFVLGWYTQQAVAQDGAEALDGGSDSTSSDTVSDIRLLDIDKNGVTGQLLPDSISQVADAADVSITSNFRFTKNAQSINDLSILWVERSQAEAESLDGVETTAQDDDTAVAEYDVLKGVKFYTYGEKNEQVRFTGAVDVADMSAAPAGEGTVIDWFDAYVSNSGTNQVKAVILGTTYGKDGETVTKTAQTVGGDTVSYTGLFGVVGMLNKTTAAEVKNLQVEGEVFVERDSSLFYAGGVAGFVGQGCKITNCSFQGTVETTVDNQATEGYTGGIAGYNFGTISECTVLNSDISGKNQSTKAGGDVYVAGIVAANNTVGTIKSCTVENSTITGTNENMDSQSLAGGIAADNIVGTIEQCKVTGGSVSTSGSMEISSVGGIAGCSDGTLKECSNSAAVTGNNALNLETKEEVGNRQQEERIGGKAKR